MKTFFVDKIDGNLIKLEDDEHNHLKNVLRLNVNDQVKVVCGDEFNYYCKVCEINKKDSVLKVEKKELNTANPKVNLTCYMALIKNDNLTLVVQKLTELGCSNFVPFESAYTVNKDKGTKTEKLITVTKQSLKQCGRSIPMNISETKNILKLDNMLKAHDLIIFANETEKSSNLNTVLAKNSNAKNIAIIVGCEGGFNNEEIKYLLAHGAKSISLGNRILRAETAAIMLTSIVLNRFKEYC